jgi:hypothetical protein
MPIPLTIMINKCSPPHDVPILASTARAPSRSISTSVILRKWQKHPQRSPSPPSPATCGVFLPQGPYDVKVSAEKIGAIICWPEIQSFEGVIPTEIQEKYAESTDTSRFELITSAPCPSFKFREQAAIGVFRNPDSESPDYLIKNMRCVFFLRSKRVT